MAATSPIQRLNSAEEYQLAEDIGLFSHDPLGYVKYAFPWGEEQLEDEKGPYGWQAAFLKELGESLKAVKGQKNKVIQEAVASGNDIGKSTLISWLILWGMSTCLRTRGTVTAGTFLQLKTKLFSELANWKHLCINSHWFDLQATALTSNQKDEKGNPLRDQWRFDIVPWNKNRPEAFAGMHNKKRRILQFFDEASMIESIIFDHADGVLTDADTEIIRVFFGNPTRKSGYFYELFGKRRHRLTHPPRHIDSRTVPGTNLEIFKQWIEDYGEDSDYVRVHVKGLFPRAGDLQFIPSDWVSEAMKRDAQPLADDPRIGGIDFALGGDDKVVARGRQGLDCKSIKPFKLPGSEARDAMRLAAALGEWIDRNNLDVVFGDAGGVGAGVIHRLKQLGYNIMEIQFGAASPNPRYLNQRTYQWAMMRDAIKDGAALPDDADLETDLTHIEYYQNARDQMGLEKKEDMKKRGLASPDDGDALSLLWAAPVPPKTFGGHRPEPIAITHEWSTLRNKRLERASKMRRNR